MEEIWNFFAMSDDSEDPFGDDDDEDDDEDDDYNDPFARERVRRATTGREATKTVVADELLDTLVSVVVEKPVSPVKDQKQKRTLSSQLQKYRKPVANKRARASTNSTEVQSDDDNDEKERGDKGEDGSDGDGEGDDGEAGELDEDAGPKPSTNDELRNTIAYDLHKLYAKNRMQNNRPGELLPGKAGAKKKKELIVSSLERELAECTFAPKVSKHADQIGRKYNEKTGGVTTSPMVVGE